MTEQTLAQQLTALGLKYNFNFHWNPDDNTWCLHGETRQGLYWETDDYEASDREQAYADAIAYAEEYNTEH